MGVCRLSTLIFAALIFAQPLVAGSNAYEEVVSIQVLLKDAARRGGYAEIPFDVNLTIVKRGDTWLPIGGQTTQNKSIIWGHVEEGAVSASAVNLKVSYWSPKDAFQPGGRAVYTLQLTRSGTSLTGSYTGIYYGENYTFWFVRKATAADKFGANDICPPSGAVTGKINVTRSPRQDFIPLSAGERPRVLFRKRDLHLIAAKAATPFGQTCLSMMDSTATGHGIRYIVAKYKGETAQAAAHAKKAQDMVTSKFSDFSNGVDEHGKIAWGPRLEDIACAFDLCYDAWTPQFRNKTAWYLINNSKVIFDMQGEWRGSEQSYDIELYGINWYAGIGMAGMALAGEQIGNLPLFPWYGDDKKSPTLATPAGLAVPAGLPVTNLTFRAAHEISLIKEPGASGTITFPEYMYVTGFKVPNDSFLAPFANNAAIKPKPGDNVSYGGVTAKWEVLPSGKIGSQSTQWTPNYEIIDIASLTERKHYTTTYLYAVLDNPAARWVECQHSLFHEKFSSPLELEYYIDGVLRRQGDFAYLEKGLHSLLVVIPTFHFQSHGTMNIAPRIVEPTEERRTKNLEFFDFEQAERNKYAQKCASLGGETYFQMMMYRCRSGLDEFFRIIKDEQGLKFPRSSARCYVDNSAARFGISSQRLFNIPPNPSYNLFSTVIPVFQTGDAPVTNCSYANQTNQKIFVHTFGLIPDTLQRRTLPSWNSEFGVTSPDNASNLIKPDPVYALIHYPLDVKVNVNEPAAVSPPGNMIAISSVNRTDKHLTVHYSTPSAEAVTISLYNLRGDLIHSVREIVTTPGNRSVIIDATVLGSQTCIMRISGSRQQSAAASFFFY